MEISPREAATLDYLDNANFLCSYTIPHRKETHLIEWRKMSSDGNHTVLKQSEALKRYTLQGGLVVEHLTLNLKNVTELSRGQYFCAVKGENKFRPLYIFVKGKVVFVFVFFFLDLFAYCF